MFAGQPVSDWTYNWVYVTGFPLLNVTVDASGAVFVSQVTHLCASGRACHRSVVILLNAQ